MNAEDEKRDQGRGKPGEPRRIGSARSGLAESECEKACQHTGNAYIFQPGDWLVKNDNAKKKRHDQRELGDRPHHSMMAAAHGALHQNDADGSQNSGRDHGYSQLTRSGSDAIENHLRLAQKNPAQYRAQKCGDDHHGNEIQ